MQVVDIEARTCTCGRFEICGHAVAPIVRLRKQPRIYKPPKFFFVFLYRWTKHGGPAPGCSGYCGKTSALLFCLGAHVVGPRRGGSESGRKKSEGFMERRANGRCAGNCSGRCSPALLPSVATWVTREAPEMESISS